MKGLELARRYYEEFGAPMIHAEFPELEDIIAVGLVGPGSECFGYDDGISADHDFEPGFCMFIPGDDVIDRRTQFRLERAYAKLPDEFLGYKRQRISPVGGNRHGLIKTADFYKARIGRPDAFESIDEWFTIPENFLAEAVNGEVFRDGYGEFTAIRNSLKKPPEDVKIKKLAGNLLLMSQAGQYNYLRCLDHGDSGAAQLAAIEFVNAAMAVCFLLGGKYMPFYKWRFRALRECEPLGGLADTLEFIITSPNGDNAATKYAAIEETAEKVIEELKKESLTEATCGDLEKHAYSVNDKVADPNLRNAGILFGV